MSMHGLILAGGTGSRLAANGVAEPKPMVRIGGVPQVVRLADTLHHLGCASVTCLVHEQFPQTAAALETGLFPVTTLFCNTPSSLHTLALGLQAIAPGPVLCTLVDTVMPWPDWSRMASSAARQLARGAQLVIAVTRYAGDDDRPLFVEPGRPPRVRRITEQPGSTLVTGGVYALSGVARTDVATALADGLVRLRAWLMRFAAAHDVRAVIVPRIFNVDRRTDLEAAEAWWSSLAPSRSIS